MLLQGSSLPVSLTFLHLLIFLLQKIFELQELILTKDSSAMSQFLLHDILPVPPRAKAAAVSKHARSRQESKAPQSKGFLHCDAPISSIAAPQIGEGKIDDHDGLVTNMERALANHPGVNPLSVRGLVKGTCGSFQSNTALGLPAHSLSLTYLKTMKENLREISNTLLDTGNQSDESEENELSLRFFEGAIRISREPFCDDSSRVALAMRLSGKQICWQEVYQCLFPYIDLPDTGKSRFLSVTEQCTPLT